MVAGGVDWSGAGVGWLWEASRWFLTWSSSFPAFGNFLKLFHFRLRLKRLMRALKAVPRKKSCRSGFTAGGGVGVGASGELELVCQWIGRQISVQLRDVEMWSQVLGHCRKNPRHGHGWDQSSRSDLLSDQE